MTRNRRVSGIEKGGVKLVLGVNYPETAPSEGTSPPLLISAAYDLPPLKSPLSHLIPSSRFIGDLVIALRESSVLSDRHTRFVLAKTSLLSPYGSEKVDDLVDTIKDILKPVIDYVVGHFAPPLAIVAEALWKILRTEKQATSGERSLRLEFFKWWSFTKWHLRSGSVIAELVVQLRPHDNTIGDIHGPVEYKVEASAKLGPPLRWPVGTGAIDDIGTAVSYKTDWKSM